MKLRRDSKHGLLAVVLAGVLACTACEMEGKGMDVMHDWSANELAMLAYVGVHDERMEANELFQGERKMLDAMLQAEAYLQARYPDEVMRFERVDNSLPGATTYSFDVRSSAAPEDTFVVKVWVNAETDGGNDIEDSRFSDMKKAELQALVEGVLRELEIPAVCNMEIEGLYGAEYDPAKPLTALLDSGLLLDVYGRIYAEQSAVPEHVDQLLADVLRGKGLCSGVRLLLVKDGALEAAQELPLRNNPYIVSDQTIRLPAMMTEVE